jgi:hypothetical protein
LEDDAVAFGEAESFVNGLEGVTVGCETGEDAVVDWTAIDEIN